MPARPPKDPATIGSFAELRAHYKQLWSELDDCRQMKGMTSEALRYRTVEVRGAKADAKAARGKLVTLSKKQKAKDEANKAGYWSGAAAITVTIFYEAFKVVGFPGGRAWAEWWGHEAVYGVIVWTVTMGFGWAYRATHSS